MFQTKALSPSAGVSSSFALTMWQDIAGRGSETGEPHLGNHAWPTMNNAILTFVPDDKVDAILAMVRAKDEETPALGLRAFVWNIEKSY